MNHKQFLYILFTSGFDYR